MARRRGWSVSRQSGILPIECTLTAKLEERKNFAGSSDKGKFLSKFEIKGKSFAELVLLK